MMNSLYHNLSTNEYLQNHDKGCCLALQDLPQPAKKQIFDRQLLRLRRNRIAAQYGAVSHLQREVCRRIGERVLDVKRDFKWVCDLGAHDGGFALHCARTDEIGRKIGVLIHTDSTLNFARQCPKAVVCDEEALPFRAAIFDLVVSILTLHQINDLPGCLRQIGQILRPDGLFLAAFFGGESLFQLRHALCAAEVESKNGAAARIYPFVDIKSAGGLLQQAKFAMPVTDLDRIEIIYRDLATLLHDLRAMGQSNILAYRPHIPLNREIISRAETIYREKFGRDDGGLPVWFDVIYMTGWRVGAGQPKALRPGSAKQNLADWLAQNPSPFPVKPLIIVLLAQSPIQQMADQIGVRRRHITLAQIARPDPGQLLPLGKKR